MDPFTISALAAKSAVLAWDVGTALYSFINNAKVVNDSVLNLHLSTVQLSTVCDATSKHVQYLRGSTSRDELQLLHGIETLLARCAQIMENLKDLIDPLRREHTNWVLQAGRQIRLDLSEKQIRTSREDIEACVSKLSHLQIILMHRDVRSGRTTLDRSQHTIDNRQSVQARSWGHTRTKVSNGDSYSLRSNSDGGSSSGDTLTSRQNFDRHDLVDQIVQDARTILANELRVVSTEEWDLASLHTRGRMDAASNGTQEEEYDPLTETARTALAKGRKSFRKGAFEDAQTELKKAVQEIEDLRKRHPQKYVDIGGVRYQLAICAFHAKDTARAEDLLAELFGRAYTTAIEAQESCHAGYLLALIHARSGRTQEAETICELVYWRLRAIFGEHHVACHETLALLGLCYDLQQQPVKAESCRALIPATSLEKLRYRVMLSFFWPWRRVVKEVKIDFLPGPPRELCWSNDNAALAWQHSDHDIEVYSTRTGHRKDTHSGKHPIATFALSPGGGCLITGACVPKRIFKQPPIIGVYRTDSGQCIQSYEPKATLSTITGIGFSPDHSCIAYADGARTVELSDMTSGWVMRHRKPVIKVHDQYGAPRFSPNGQELVVCHNRGLFLHSAETHQLVQYLEHGNPSKIGGWVFSPDASLIAVAMTSEEVIQFQLSPAPLRQILTTSRFRLPYALISEIDQDLTYLPTNRLLVARYNAVGQGKGVVIYDVVNAAAHVLDDDPVGFERFKFSPDGTLLAAVARSGAFIKIWDMERIVQRL